MDGKRGWIVGVAGTAQAATITAYPRPYAKPGAGPFTWTFAPSAPGGPVAWKLSSETAWHRCTTDTTATFPTLPEGRYSLLVMDDVPDCADTDMGAPVAPPLPPSRVPQLVVDGTPPVVPAPVVTVTGSPVSSTKYVTISAPPSDPLSGVASVLWNTGDGAQPLGGTTRGVFGWRYALGIFSGGVTVTDRAGNTASQPFTVTTLPPPDRTPPSFAVTRLSRSVLARRSLGVTTDRAGNRSAATMTTGRIVG